MPSLIFEELGIDHRNMMVDPDDFARQCYKAADMLKTILQENTSVSNFVRNQEKNVEFDFTGVDNYVQDMWNYCNDTVPVGALTTVADKLRKLAKDIEYMARDKAMYAMAADDNRISKPMAIELYKVLRKKFNEWLEAMEILEYDVTATKMPPMPGNYGSTISLVKKYVYMFSGEKEGYLIHLSVLKRLELEYMNLSDTHDYINAHPELGVTITELTN